MRVRNLFVVLAALLVPALAVLAMACGTPADDEAAPAPSPSPTVQSPTPSPSPSPTVAESPGSTPEVSWTWIRTREYRDWENPPGWGERRTSGSPHSDAKIIYIDPEIAAAVGSGETRFPAGATIVKEGYDAGGDLAIIAAMQRLPDRGWFFAEYRADGSVIEEDDNPPLCTQCHTGSQDGVLAFSLD